MEVEYNSFKDKVVTFFARIVDKDFRAKFKKLKKSDETYVFNNNDKGNNSFSTDGNKLFINYSLTKEAKAAGQDMISMVKHETTHGVQFEHGELGFENTASGWSAISYDIMDEYEAHTSQNGGSSITTIPGSSREWWKGSYDANNNFVERTPSERIESLQNVPNYGRLPLGPVNNSNSGKVKNNQFYMLPYKSR
jgi:hypothetical protein